LRGLPHAVVMGDFNCEPDSPEIRLLTRTARLGDPAGNLHTWPSWQPSRMIDHILVSPVLAERCESCWIDVEPRRLERPSDHAPVVAVFRT